MSNCVTPSLRALSVGRTGCSKGIKAGKVYGLRRYSQAVLRKRQGEDDASAEVRRHLNGQVPKWTGPSRASFQAPTAASSQGSRSGREVERGERVSRWDSGRDNESGRERDGQGENDRDRMRLNRTGRWSAEKSTLGDRLHKTTLDADGWCADPRYRKPSDGRREAYFKRMFPDLVFPPELAQRVLSHNSLRFNEDGHNAALAFIGRRVMSAYFLLFLHGSPNLSPKDDVEEILAHALNTHILGDRVGSEWGVGRELRWAPSTDLRDIKDSDGELPGLNKVQGETVQAILGAVFRQHGGVVAHRIFHTRILPLLLVRGGVPLRFHDEVKAAAKQMEKSQPSGKDVEAQVE